MIKKLLTSSFLKDPKSLKERGVFVAMFSLIGSFRVFEKQKSLDPPIDKRPACLLGVGGPGLLYEVLCFFRLFCNNATWLSLCKIELSYGKKFQKSKLFL
jgi:hypothetical protein